MPKKRQSDRRRDEDYGKALRRARFEYEERTGERLTNAVIGAGVARLLRLEEPVSEKVVSHWFAGEEPRFRIGLALALVLHGDPYAMARVPRPTVHERAVSEGETAPHRQGRAG